MPAFRTLLLVASAAAAACASTAPTCRTRAGLSLDEAREVVAVFEARQRRAAGELRAPTDLNEATEILKRDQIDQFPLALAWAEKQPGIDALALRAQVELAWGEAQLSLAQVFADVSARQHELVRSLETADGRSPEAEASLRTMREQLAESAGVADALSRLAAEHVAAGAKLARRVIAEAPSSYVGYRVAADHHRLREDWTRFDEAVAKLAELKPDSNGLLFVRGAAALVRTGDDSEGTNLLRQALERDPGFLRARALLLMAEGSLDARHRELLALKKSNPTHQIVVWAGPALESAHDAREVERITSNGNRAASPAMRE